MHVFCPRPVMPKLARFRIIVECLGARPLWTSRSDSSQCTQAGKMRREHAHPRRPRVRSACRSREMWRCLNAPRSDHLPSALRAQYYACSARDCRRSEASVTYSAALWAVSGSATTRKDTRRPSTYARTRTKTGGGANLRYVQLWLELYCPSQQVVNFEYHKFTSCDEHRC